MKARHTLGNRLELINFRLTVDPRSYVVAWLGKRNRPRLAGNWIGTHIQLGPRR
jgi:hypothetical protein